jgi:Cu/Ag efflux pump CusA
MQQVEGAVDVQPEQQTDIPFLTVKYRRDALARHGLSARNSRKASRRPSTA